MKNLITVLFFTLIFSAIFAQEAKKDKTEKSFAEIKFEKQVHNFGTFAADTAILDCEFKFTNIGNSDLYIHQAFASCGCTVPEIPTAPIKPGESGTIKVTYNGMHKAPGSMRRSISIHTNAKEEIVRIYITGKMLPRKIKETPIINIEEDL